MIRRAGAVLLLAVLLGLLALLGAVAHYVTHIDTAGQGVLILGSVQAIECTDVGGCMAMSARELNWLAQQAALAGASGCSRRQSL